jgi:hypothetical protein
MAKSLRKTNLETILSNHGSIPMHLPLTAIKIVHLTRGEVVGREEFVEDVIARNPATFAHAT